jgi:hypothetical protein
MPVIAVLFSCGGGGSGSGGAGAFSQANLAGTWDVIEFDSGSGFGWARFNMTIGESGNFILNSGTDSSGFTYPGPPVDTLIRWTIDGSGTVRMSDAVSGLVSPSFYGSLSSNKNLGVATDNAGIPFTYTLLVSRKAGVDGVTYGDADIRGRNFVYHQIYAGPDNVWIYGYGSIDALGRVTLDNAFDPSGALPGYPLVNFRTFAVDSTGIVTNPPGNDFYGWLTHDKSSLLGLIDDPVTHSKYQFIVIQFLGATYTQADLAATWRWHVLYGWNSPGWVKGAWTIDAAGAATYDPTTYLTESGWTTPPAGSEMLGISTAGVITNSISTPYHGMMSSGKDLYVRTKSFGTGPTRYSIGISVK